ncbi:lipocalin family protein [Elizabethkingia anophelis]|uniref:lipocalin family protein n=1 Tax=Elizabethkingia anophelis TaxID=1117645 RepID=UPI00136EC627|nr:lipocalin family protein [Elizabethkingia anophelis]MYY27364.1 hypothetical protein [Elizabethkingia anophelis]
MKSILYIGQFCIITILSYFHAQASGYNKSTLKGTWQITKVDYDNNYKIKPFDEGVDIKCFIGSEWKFVPNNNTGSYSVSNADCQNNILTLFKFNVTPNGEFSFKKTPKGIKAKTIIGGYFLQLQNQNQDSFELVQSLNDDSTPVNVLYYFKKITK